MSDTLAKYDTWISGDDGPAALVLRENLMPVEGHDGVIFPPTFASGDGFPGGYNIDVFPDQEVIGEAAAEMSKKDSKSKPLIDLFPNSPNVCLIDTVGSQANRIEPIFADEKYAALIPQVTVQAGEKSVSILEAGHRAGDALMRCSELQEELQTAFKEVLRGDAKPLAKIAPTSLVFGVWDSRDTQAKLPRLISSTIRAMDVRRLTRSAQFTPATEYVAEGLLDEPKDKKAADAYSERGFNHVPATGTHGGVIATGGIRRDAALSLAALQLLSAGDEEGTLALRRYILGLSLVALTANTSAYLRQGCILVLDPDNPPVLQEVYRNGKRKDANLSHDDALAFAADAAKAFGVGEDRTVAFDKQRAKADVKKKG